MRFLPAFWAVAFLLTAESAAAAPTHYWRFESSPGFGSDSLGAATLAASGTPTQAALPGAGRGAEFDVVAGNSQAADLDPGDAFSTPLSPTNEFTIEVLVHMDSDPGIFGYAFAGFASGDSPGQVGWVLQTRQSSASGPDVLRLATGFGGSVTFFNSQIPLVAGKDYYIAVAFDTLASGAKATFWVANLTDGGPVQSSVVVLGGEVFLGINPIGTFVIGADVHNTTGLDGLIDEVRLSDSVLPPSALLVPVVGEVPALAPPGLGGLALLLLGAARLAFRRRGSGA